MEDIIFIVLNNLFFVDDISTAKVVKSSISIILKYSGVIVKEMLGLHYNHLFLFLHGKLPSRDLLVLGWIHATQTYLVSIPGTCKCNFKGKKIFADVVKNIDSGRFPWVIQLSSTSNHSILTKYSQREIWHMEKKVMGPGRQRSAWCTHKASDAGGHQAERPGSEFPLSLRREHSPVNILIFAQWKWFQAYGFQKLWENNVLLF